LSSAARVGADVAVSAVVGVVEGVGDQRDAEGGELAYGGVDAAVREAGLT